MVMMIERRAEPRTSIDWPVSVYHPYAEQFLNARSVDVSRGGAKIRLDDNAPVTVGQTLELNFPRTATLAKVAGCFSRIKTARVVRVEPEFGGEQQVAVRFDKQAVDNVA
jgi:c-di-GMP-binding flagellar brake protein YcgR